MRCAGKIAIHGGPITHPSGPVQQSFIEAMYVMLLCLYVRIYLPVLFI